MSNLAGIPEQPRQMIALLLALFPDATARQTESDWGVWLCTLPDGRAVEIRERRDFWEKCDRCGLERQRMMQRGGTRKYVFSTPAQCRDVARCEAEMFNDFAIREARE